LQKNSVFICFSDPESHFKKKPGRSPWASHNVNFPAPRPTSQILCPGPALGSIFDQFWTRIKADRSESFLDQRRGCTCAKAGFEHPLHSFKGFWSAGINLGSVLGQSGINFGVNLGLFLVHFGIILELFWGAFWGHFGVYFRGIRGAVWELENRGFARPKGSVQVPQKVRTF